MIIITMQARSSDESKLMKHSSKETKLFPGGLIYSLEVVVFQVEPWRLKGIPLLHQDRKLTLQSTRLQGRNAGVGPGTQAGDQRTWHFPMASCPAASSNLNVH